MGKKGLYLYIILWVVYSFNGVLYEPSGILARGSIFLILFMSIVDTYYVIKKKITNPYIKGLNLLLLMFTIYGGIFILNREPLYNGRLDIVPHYVYIKTIYIALLPFYSFYRYCIEGVLTRKRIIKLMPVFVIIASAKFVSNTLIRENMGFEGEVTNNYGYFFVALMPFVYIIRQKQLFRYIYLLVLFAFALMSVKRGAILISVFFILWYIRNDFKTARRSTVVWVLLGTFVLLMVSVASFNYVLLHNDYFASRFESTMSGDIGEREDMYTAMFDWYLKYNSAEGLLLGNGAYTSIRLIGQPAHNDWLELALAQGLLGIIVYIVYWISLLRAAYVQKKSNNIIAFSISSSFFIIYFMKSVFSMSYASIPFFAMVIIGYAMALHDRPSLQNR